MATLHPAAYNDYIERSVKEYIDDTLVTIEGLTVLQPDIAYSSTPARWVGWSPALLSSVVDAEGWITTGWYGLTVRGFLEFTLVEKVALRTNSYALSQMARKVRQYFSPLTTIPIYDYGDVTPLAVGVLFLGPWRERIVDSGSRSGLKQLSASVPVDRLDLMAPD